MGRRQHQLYTVHLGDSPTAVVETNQGTRYRKQVVRFGTWASPFNADDTMTLDIAWAEQIVQNFKDKRIGRVPVPLGHDDWNPDRNAGEVESLEIQPDGLYAVIAIRDGATAEDIDADLIWDVSVSFDNHYIDKKSGEDVGPTLLHIALVNNPYLKGMQPFEALSNRMNAVMLSEYKENKIMSAVKNDRDFPVEVKWTDEDGNEQTATVEPGAEVEVPEAAAEGVTTQVADAEAPKADEDAAPDAPADDAKPEEPGAPANNDEAARNAELEAENETLRKELSEGKAQRQYESLLSDGKLVPAQKDAFLALSTAQPSTVSLSDNTTKSSTDLLVDLLNAGPKRVSFSEEGSGNDEPAKTPWDELSDEQRAGNEKLGVTADQFNAVHSESVTN